MASTNLIKTPTDLMETSPNSQLNPENKITSNANTKLNVTFNINNIRLQHLHDGVDEGAVTEAVIKAAEKRYENGIPEQETCNTKKQSIRRFVLLDQAEALNVEEYPKSEMIDPSNYRIKKRGDRKMPSLITDISNIRNPIYSNKILATVVYNPSEKGLKILSAFPVKDMNTKGSRPISNNIFMIEDGNFSQEGYQDIPLQTYFQRIKDGKSQEEIDTKVQEYYKGQDYILAL